LSSTASEEWEAVNNKLVVLILIHAQSYITNTHPKDWLSANIIVMFKEGIGVCNYRPISLTAGTRNFEYAPAWIQVRSFM